MPESIPAPLVIDTLRDTFREARAALVAEGWAAPGPQGRAGGRGHRGRRGTLDRRRAGGAHDPARRPLRLGEHAARRRPRRARARLLSDRPALPRERQGPPREPPT